MARISLATDELSLERLPARTARLQVVGAGPPPGDATAAGPALEVTDRPAGGSGVVAGRTVLLVGLGRRIDSDGIAAGTLDLAEHLAASAASVTLLTGFTRPSGRRHRGTRGAIRPDRPDRSATPAVVHLDHRACSGPDGPTPVTRAAEAATRLAAAASAALPAPPDLVIATSPGLGGAIAGARLARRHRAPLLLLVHDLLAASDGYGPVGAAVERHALACADRILVTDEAFREPIARYGIDPARIRHLPSWVGADRSVLGRAEARALLRWPAAARIALAVGLDGGGRAEREPSWAGAVARRLAERPDVRLVLADDVPAAALPHAVAAADLLVVTDQRGTAAAADVRTWLATGRPIVALAPRSAGLARAVAGSSGAGVCVRPGDDEGLADAIAGLTARSGLLDLMGERAQRQARRSPDRTAAMCVVDEVIGSVLDGVMDGVMEAARGSTDRASRSPAFRDFPRSS